VGFGCRLALPLLLLLQQGLRARRELGLLLALLAYAFAAGISAPLRLYAGADAVAVPASYWVSSVVGGLLALLLALGVCRAGPALIVGLAAGSGGLARRWQALGGRITHVGASVHARRDDLLRAEQMLGRWSLVLGLLVLLCLLLGLHALGQM